MREAAWIGRRTIATAAVAAVLVVAAGGCDIAGLTGPADLLDVSMPGSTPEAGQEVAFEGQLVEVALEHTLLRLADGTAVSVSDSTVLHDTFGVASAEAARDTLASEREVIAWGTGVVESVDPLVIVGVELTLKPAARLEFEGRVEAVDLEAGTVSLEGGTTVRVTRGTEVGDDFHVPSLEAAAEALGAGEELVAWGHGWLRSEEPRRLLARGITFKVRVPDPVEFEGEVAAIDADAGTVAFASGTVLHVTAETQINAEHGIASLAAAKERLEAGEDLVAWGAGVVESEEPRTIRATNLTFKVRVAEFEGHVSSLFAELDGFELASGTVVKVNGETSYSNEYGIPSMQAVKEVLEAGGTVTAWGHGRLESEEPRTVVAQEVVFKEIQ